MTGIETGSETWLFIEAWATKQIEKHRQANDSPQCTYENTQFLRGKIAVLKALLTLPDPPDGGPITGATTRPPLY